MHLRRIVTDGCNSAQAITSGFLNDFPPAVRQCSESIVGAAVEIYGRMSTDLLPTPAKSHYVFNLRDLSKCVQGVLQADVGSVREQRHIFRLFCHESLRVFHDRLINNDDKVYFHTILSEMAAKHFGETIEAESFVTDPIIFGDFMKVGAERSERVYEDITNTKKLKTVLEEVSAPPPPSADLDHRSVRSIWTTSTCNRRRR